MNWKDKILALTHSANGTPIYNEGYYIIGDGSDYLTQVPTKYGFVVKIIRLSEKRESDGITYINSVWFNNKNKTDDAYSWEAYYDNQIIRMATKKEIKKWEEYYK